MMSGFRRNNASTSLRCDIALFLPLCRSIRYLHYMELCTAHQTGSCQSREAIKYCSHFEDPSPHLRFGIAPKKGNRMRNSWDRVRAVGSSSFVRRRAFENANKVNVPYYTFAFLSGYFK